MNKPSSFRESCKRAAAIVKSWPDWKKVSGMGFPSFWKPDPERLFDKKRAQEFFEICGLPENHINLASKAACYFSWRFQTDILVSAKLILLAYEGHLEKFRRYGIPVEIPTHISEEKYFAFFLDQLMSYLMSYLEEPKKEDRIDFSKSYYAYPVKATWKRADIERA